MVRSVRQWVSVGAVMAAFVASCASSTDVATERADEVTAEPLGAPPETDDSASLDDSGDDALDDAARPDGDGSLAWSLCEESGLTLPLECATLIVPLDYDDPDGATIEIAVARARAFGTDRIGSLVFNPGGPGGSGIEALGFLPLTMSPDILDRFDLVSFDPRGVGMSTALECDNEVDDEITLLADGDDAGWADLVAEDRTRTDTCTADSIELARHVGTNNAARDMDLLREALGDSGLTYVGYSYGTRLGATYAELFPQNIRALVLDAAVKPTSDSSELGREQGGGFDRALENFAAACDDDTDCVLHEVGPTLEVIAELEAEIAEIGSFPTEDPDRVLTPGELSLGIAAALYSKASWPLLASALFTASAEQDGTLLQVLGDALVGRQTDGTYDNSNVANTFINCADDPARPTVDEQQVLADAAADLSVHFDDFLRASTGCLGIDAATDPLTIGPATGAAPIVVIGNTGDPATPYEWAVELAGSLDSAVLYTVEAEGHTAYGSIECVTSDIDAYLIDLVVPDADARCSDNAGADFFLPEGSSELDQVFAFFDCLRDNGVDIADFSEADILADPTLDTILGDIDFSDPDLLAAIGSCQFLVPDF